MAFCSNCGKELAVGAKFCFECGTPVAKADETVRKTVFSGEIHTIDKKIRIRAGVGAAIIVIFIGFVGIYGSLFNGVGSLIGVGKNPINATVPSGNKTVPTISADTGTNESEGIYSYQIRNYIGKNVASIGSVSGNYVVDEYGAGELKLIFVTKDELRNR